MNPWLSLGLLGLKSLTGRLGVDTQVCLSMIFQIVLVEVVKIYFDFTKNIMVMVSTYLSHLSRSY